MNVRGYDLNPVMVVVSKARCLDPAEYPSLKPLAADIGRKSTRAFDVASDDSLLTWLTPSSVAAFRSIEAAVQVLLIDDKNYLSMRARGTDAVSGLAAFFYVALFRALRKILRSFHTSNPTWVKRPGSIRARLRPRGDLVRAAFRHEVAKMLPLPVSVVEASRAERVLAVASSEKLPLPGSSVDFVLSSPPYCTRIDYAVATRVELALLGFGAESGFEELRRGLIGNTTVPKAAASVSEAWGGTCQGFLNSLKEHCSKASATYYYKNHMQYFDSMSRSISEIGRVLKPGGRCVLVVQDSYYKDLHNDLPLMLTEMGVLSSLILGERMDFPLSRTMAGVHPGTKEYRSFFGATESVLVFQKQPSGTEQINYIPDIVQPVGSDVVGSLRKF